MADMDDEGGKGSATSIEAEDSLWSLDKENKLVQLWEREALSLKPN